MDRLDRILRGIERSNTLQEHNTVLLHFLISKVVRMAATEQNVVDALSSEKADLSAFAALLTPFLAAVAALLGASKASPDFDALLASVGENHTALSALFSAVSAEDAKVEPPAPPPPAPPVIVSITLSQTSAALSVDGQTGPTSAAITASASDESALSFASSDAAVAVVDSAGTITAVGAGSCVVIVSSASGASASVSVSVVAAVVAG